MDPLSIIAGIIAIVDSILATYSAIREIKGLPKAFEEVERNLPLVKETLQIAEQQLHDNSPSDAEKRAIEPIITACESKLKELNKILTKIQKQKKEGNGEIEDWSSLAKLYQKVVVPMGKAHRVESLMSAMIDSLKALAIHQMFKAATQPQIGKLEEAIKKLSQVEPSIPDSDFEPGRSTVNQTNNDRSNGFLCTEGTMHNVVGGNVWKADQNMNFGMDMSKWLESITTPLHFEEKLHELLRIAQRSPGSGSWFLKLPALSDWIDGDSQKLLAYGHAGAGKSVLASIVIHHLQNLHNRLYGDHNVACLYVYFDYKKQKTQTLINILSSLLVQLLRCSRKVSHEIQCKFDDWRQNKPFLGEGEYVDMITSQAMGFRRIYIIVDALDQCCSDTSTNTLSEFLDICCKLPRTFHSLFTTRTDLHSQFLRPSFQLKITAHPDDISAYLDNFIDSRPVMRSIVDEGHSRNHLFREHLFNRIISRSDGLFLLAHLHLANLASTNTLQEFEYTLDNLSGDLTHVYKAALERIEIQEDKQRNTAIMLLSWITFAKRPLTIAEATQALYIQNALRELSMSGYVIPKVTVSPEAEWSLTSVCGGMIVGVVEKNITFLHFAHRTARKFLKKYLLVEFQDACSIMTEVCLRCLINTPVKPPKEKITAQNTSEHFTKNYPFFHYAANNWGFHMADKVKGPVYQLAWKFLSEHENKEKLDRAVSFMEDTNISREEQFTGLHIAAHFGLTTLVQKAVGLKKPLDINSRTKRNETPLHWAVSRGHREFSELLISQQADRKVQNGDKMTPLHIAIDKDDSDMICLLLSDHCGELELADIKGYTPLITAVKKRNAKVVQKLLRLGAKTGSEDGHGWTALRWAAQLGYKMIIEILIRYKASVSSPTKDGWTLLRWAASEGRSDIITLLKGMNINLDEPDKDGKTALQWAVRYQCSMATWVLLQAKVNVNKRDNTGTTALHVAAETFHLSVKGNDVLWLLLANGAKVNTQTKTFGQTPLHIAASEGSESAIWLLLSKGADPTKLDVNRRTALHCAVAGDHIQAAQLLLWKSTDLINAADHEKRTVLHYAASQGNVALVEMLINWDADINARDHSGQTALHIAVLQSHDDIAVFLIRKDADLEITCRINRKRVSLDELVHSMNNTDIMGAIDEARQSRSSYQA
ncbi:nacht ankyrin domain-containing protein [Fusarium coicis]|nr:nacht ankyrin domain-containing protein [Fusarium coicis]